MGGVAVTVGVELGVKVTKGAGILVDGEESERVDITIGETGVLAGLMATNDGARAVGVRGKGEGVIRGPARPVLFDSIQTDVMGGVNIPPTHPRKNESSDNIPKPISTPISTAKAYITIFVLVWEERRDAYPCHRRPYMLRESFVLCSQPQYS
jgi:hypothetical protein